MYEYALELEPKPDRDELTFGQQQLVNRARSFVTMKMKRRQNLRDQKKDGKNLKRLRKILSDQLMSQQGMQQEIEVDDEELDEEDDDEEENDVSEKKGKAKGTKVRKVVKSGKIVNEIDDEDDDEDDEGADWVPVKTL